MSPFSGGTYSGPIDRASPYLLYIRNVSCEFFFIKKTLSEVPEPSFLKLATDHHNSIMQSAMKEHKRISFSHKLSNYV
jgi:hypothetical protein